MPAAPKRPKLAMLKPRLEELPLRVPMLTQRPARSKTLQDKREANGRTLALDGAAWRRLRRSVLSEQPMCPECRDQGLLVPATEVDHADNNPANNERSNLVGLCKSHHSIKTMADLYGRDPKARGCDASGVPLDPTHPWNRGTVAALLKKSPATECDQPTCSLFSTAKGTK